MINFKKYEKITDRNNFSDKKFRIVSLNDLENSLKINSQLQEDVVKCRELYLNYKNYKESVEFQNTQNNLLNIENEKRIKEENDIIENDNILKQEEIKLENEKIDEENEVIRNSNKILLVKERKNLIKKIKFEKTPKLIFKKIEKIEISNEEKEEINRLKNIYKNEKDKLPAIDSHTITPQTTLDWESNNVIILDYDGLTKEEIDNTIIILEEKMLAYMISPSGFGIKLFFLFTNLNNKNFKDVYSTFALKMDDFLGLKHDSACNDGRRLCFLTNDFEIIDREFLGNYDARQFSNKGIVKEKSSSTKKEKIEKYDVEINLQDVEELFSEAYNIFTTQKIVTCDDYHEWTQGLLLSIKYITRGNDDFGLKWFKEFSMLDKNYSPKNDANLASTFYSFNNFKSSSPKYFVAWCEKYGVIINPQFTLKINSSRNFWFYNEKEELTIVNSCVEELFKSKFFRIDDRREIYYKEGNFLKMAYDFGKDSSEHIYYKVLSQHFNEILKDFEFENNEDFKIIKKIKDIYNILEFKKIELVNVDMSLKFKRDTKTDIYLYTEEGILTITASSIKLDKYNEDDFIDENWLIKGNNKINVKYDKDAKYQDYKSLEFYKKISETKENYLYLQRIIGYMTHTHRSLNDNFGILLIDGKETEDNGGGGTGKSLITRNLKHIRKTLEFNNPIYSRFLYSNFNQHTNINFEDVNWQQFSILNLRNFYDLKISPEKKGLDPIEIEGDETPRVIVSSNYSPDSLATADTRRWHIFNPSRFFNPKNTVADYLGFKMFDYTEKEWSNWLAFMIECCQNYLKNGLNPIDNWNYIEEKKGNDLEDSVNYITLRDWLSDVLNDNNDKDYLEISQYQISVNNPKIVNINKNVKLFIEKIGKEFEYKVNNIKCLKRNSSNFQKKIFTFEKIKKDFHF